MAVKISDKDNGYSRLFVNAKQLGTRTSVRVGVNDAPHPRHPNMSIADIGKIHEFGLGTVPERSFLRAWVDTHQAQWFDSLRKAAKERLYYRVQPVGKSITGHTSGLAYEKVAGIFAFEDPSQLFETYTASQVAKNPEGFEMVAFKGQEVDRPADSEGVVVNPTQEVSRAGFRHWLEEFAQMCSSGVRRRIINGIAPALMDETVKRKGSGGDTPLIDSGALLAAITYEIG